MNMYIMRPMMKNLKLITHQSDKPLTNKIIKMRPSCISQWYSLNLDEKNLSVESIPFGLSNKMSKKNLTFVKEIPKNLKIDNKNLKFSKFIKENLFSSIHVWEKINKSFESFSGNNENRKIFFFKKEDSIYSSDLFIQGTSNDDILPNILFVNAVFNSDVIKFAVPSAVFNATLPVKPSVTITFTFPSIN